MILLNWWTEETAWVDDEGVLPPSPIAAVLSVPPASAIAEAQPVAVVVEGGPAIAAEAAHVSWLSALGGGCLPLVAGVLL